MDASSGNLPASSQPTSGLLSLAKPTMPLTCRQIRILINRLRPMDIGWWSTYQLGRIEAELDRGVVNIKTLESLYFGLWHCPDDPVRICAEIIRESNLYMRANNMLTVTGG